MTFQGTASWLASRLGRHGFIAGSLRPLYEHSLAAMTAGRGIAWSINGLKCRIDPRQRRRIARAYDAPVARWLRERVRPGDLCVNVGANIGVYVLQFASWNAPRGRVVAFEPNPYARAILNRHVRYNHLQTRVQIVAAAVSDREGESAFFADGSGDGMSRLGAPNPLLPAVLELHVPTVTLDGFFAASPEWLVIDVEGFELQVLRGARRVLRECAGVVVELHPDSWSLPGTSREQFENFVEENSLEIIALSGHADPLSTYGHIALQRRN